MRVYESDNPPFGKQYSGRGVDGPQYANGQYVNNPVMS